MPRRCFRAKSSATFCASAPRRTRRARCCSRGCRPIATSPQRRCAPFPRPTARARWARASRCSSPCCSASRSPMRARRTARSCSTCSHARGASAPSNESSAIELGFHTELTYSAAAPWQSFEVAAPDFVLLLALRCAAGPRGRDVDRRCPRPLRRARRGRAGRAARARFELRAPHSFVASARGRGPAAPARSAAPRRAEHRVRHRVRRARRGPGRRGGARRAAARVRRAVATAERRARARRAARHREHALCARRSAYDARFDGRDRWLQRGYVRRSLRGLTAGDPGRFRVLA